MKILLEELQHQTDALEAIIDNFKGVKQEYGKIENPYANVLVNDAYDDKTNIDIKMETGTGKTYVYTRMMYEMHQRYGLFKFVLIVPSPAIKVGTKNFIESDYARRHFSQFYGNTSIELSVINAGDFKAKSGRKNFPAQLLNFVEGSRQNTHVIHVLLINADMLRSSSMTRDDYDQTLIGGITSPIEAIRNTNPIVIVDEPHRFPRDKKNYEAIKSITPQMIVRFGATFPDIKIGKGKNSVLKKDYYRGVPQYDLNAVESFNDGLVKGIDIYYPDLSEQQAKNIYAVDSVKAKELVLKQGKQSWTLNVGDSLSKVDDDFEGDVEYSGSKELSNGLEIEVGMKLIPGTFRSSYQELVIQDAIDKHFEIEEANFLRQNQKQGNMPRIKTLSLFFIDSIKSYRNEDGWLKLTFERLLKRKLSSLITEYQYKSLPREKEYLDFLRATQANLALEDQLVHAGYFGEDRGTGDEAIQAEVDDILKNKEKLLSFKDDKGNWQTRRFLFSKWTLREGWDNPNVFVIAKLRTSGSENSKIQEVGRGLRLPVDETGHRIHTNEYEPRLAFLIGYDEMDFAKKLVGEINSDIKIDFSVDRLTNDMIRLIVDRRQKKDPLFNDEKLLESLDNLSIINRKNEFKEEVIIEGKKKTGYDWLSVYYPEINDVQLRKGIVRTAGDNKKSTVVKLRKENWNKVKDLWKQFSSRYMIEFKRIPDTIETVIYDVFSNIDLFDRDTPQRVHETFDTTDNKATLVVREESYGYVAYRDGIAYGQFLKQLHHQTNIPVDVLHSNLLRVLKNDLKGDNRYLSETSLKNLAREFKRRFNEVFAQLYEYKSLDFSASTSVYDLKTNNFVDEISSGLLGIHNTDVVSKEERDLYDRPPLFYDSADPEKKLLEHNYAKSVTVFGKLPKNSIRVPKYTGGTTTPDLIYVIEKEEDSVVYLVVETKAENMRIEDQNILQIQEKFFDMLGENVEYTEAVSPEDVHRKLREIIGG